MVYKRIASLVRDASFDAEILLTWGSTIVEWRKRFTHCRCLRRCKRKKRGEGRGHRVRNQESGVRDQGARASTRSVIPESAAGGCPESRKNNSLLDIPPRRDFASSGMTIVAILGVSLHPAKNYCLSIK